MNILEEIVYFKKLQIDEEKRNNPIENFEINEDYDVRNFEGSLKNKGISVIAEVKKASPSKGIISENFNPIKAAQNYEKCGVDAISVLTEKKYFLGNNQYIMSVKRETSKPVLRKDFIIDEYQIYQSRYLRADAILLIVAVLKNNLKHYYETANSINLHCLVEVHDREELEIALESGCKIIGINNRNLNDFEVSLKNTEDLIKYIPKDRIVVSESGINSVEDIKFLKQIGVNAVLIGETFMRKPDLIEGFLEECHDKN